MAAVQTHLMRAFGALSTRVYRATGGRVLGKMRGVPVLLLTVAGRKSGAEHTTVVSYFEDEGRFVVTGSAGGAASDPQWFLNLRQADRAVVEVGPERTDVAVSIAEGEERTMLWRRLVAGAPFFAKYQDKVEREIPMALLTPLAKG